jgi:prepilin-type N-terminal cleavage/methylation domain-containing protein
MRFFKRHNKPRLRADQKGFTLVELLIVMGLFGILLTVVTDMFVSTLDVQIESSAHSTVSQDGRFILARISYDVERASSITTPASLGASGPALAMVVGGVAYSYALSGNNLQLTTNLGANNLNSSETTISSLSFQRLGNVAGKDTIRLSFLVTSKAQPNQGPRTETFTTTVGRR